MCTIRRLFGAIYVTNIYVRRLFGAIYVTNIYVTNILHTMDLYHYVTDTVSY